MEKETVRVTMDSDISISILLAGGLFVLFRNKKLMLNTRIHSLPLQHTEAVHLLGRQQ